MADLISIEPGSPPWQPSNDSRLVETYQFYDRPLIGLIEQGGMQHLFWCIAGEIEPWNLWAYLRIEPDERSELETGDFDAVFERLKSRGPLMLSIAHDGEGVVDSALVAHPDQLWETVETLVRGLLREKQDPELIALLRTRLMSDVILMASGRVFFLDFKTATTGALGASRAQETWWAPFSSEHVSK